MTFIAYVNVRLLILPNKQMRSEFNHDSTSYTEWTLAKSQQRDNSARQLDKKCFSVQKSCFVLLGLPPLKNV
jgi:hypothetical protein